MQIEVCSSELPGPAGAMNDDSGIGNKTGITGMQQPYATHRSATSGTERAQTVSLAVRDVEHRLSAGESALLLGALLALAVSMASFIAL